MSKTLVVFGATGRQGSSVIDHVLNHAQLAQQFKLRGITRDATKPAAKALQEKGVEIVQADADVPTSLEEAFQGCHTAFIVTTPIFDAMARVREITQGKALGDAAVAAGVDFLIFSTLPWASKLSGGKYQHVDHFDAKAEVEAHIRTLPIKSTFPALGSYMQNFRELLLPRPTGDGSFAISTCMAPTTQFPLVDVADAGKWVNSILLDPGAYEGRFIAAATKIYTLLEIVEIISRATGKAVTYNQIPESVFRGFLPEAMADDVVDMALYYQDFGYYGPETAEMVNTGSCHAVGQLTTFETYIYREPLALV